MGRQLPLLFTEEDDKAFFDVMRDKFGALVMRGFFDDPAKKIFERQSEFTPAEFTLFLVPQDLSGEVGAKYNEAAKCFMLRDDGAPIIEFSRAEVFNDRMHSGRVWYDPRRWREDTKEYEFKSERFRKWAESIYRWIKREYVYIKNEGYAGPDALRRSEAGEFRITR